MTGSLGFVKNRLARTQHHLTLQRPCCAAFALQCSQGRSQVCSSTRLTRCFYGSAGGAQNSLAVKVNGVQPKVVRHDKQFLRHLH